MKSCFLLLMVVLAVSTSAMTQTAADSDDSRDATAVASKLFAAMRAKDAVAIRALFIPEGQLVAVDKPRDGQGLSKTRVFTADAFAKLIAEAKGAEFIETMAQPEVKVFGDMALVFGRYTFYVGDKFSHCGTNSFHLVRTGDGWKIANAASTLEFVCGQNNTSSANEKSARRTLNIYFIDVEGGAATLIVTPAGESVLIDAGWDGANGRDARRIQQAMQQGGVTTIDHLIVSHYHRDHYGGVPELSRLVTVKRFYDHGKMTALDEDPQFAERYGAYQAAAKGEAITLKAGDSISLKATAGMPPIKLLCVAANAVVIAEKTAPNPECDPALEKKSDASENGRSVGMRLQWGDFDFLNLADLTSSVLSGLICPGNQIGEIDLYQATWHGGTFPNNAILLHSLRPTVTVMINGPRKGGHEDVVKLLQDMQVPLYQLHRNVQTRAEQNTPVEFIANLDEQPDEGNLIAVEIDAVKRSFTVTNSRTKGTHTYRIK